MIIIEFNNVAYSLSAPNSISNCSSPLTSYQSMNEWVDVSSFERQEGWSNKSIEKNVIYVLLANLHLKDPYNLLLFFFSLFSWNWHKLGHPLVRMNGKMKINMRYSNLVPWAFQQFKLDVMLLVQHLNNFVWEGRQLVCNFAFHFDFWVNCFNRFSLISKLTENKIKFSI